MLFFSTATSAGKAAKRRGVDETRVGKERRAEPRGGEETRVGEQRRGEERRAGPERGFEDRRWSWSGPEVARKGGDTCCSQLPIGALSHRSLYPTVSTAPLTPTTHPNTSAPNPGAYKYEAQICPRAPTHKRTPSFRRPCCSTRG